MSPIDFNPNGKPTDVIKQIGHPKSDSKEALENNRNISKSQTKNDKYSRSETLQKLYQAKPSVQELKAHEEKISSLKQQIADRTLPILSENESVRLESAKIVAEKIMVIEEQMAKLDE